MMLRKWRDALGLVLAVLGAMHFFNMYAVLKLRRKETQFYEQKMVAAEEAGRFPEAEAPAPT